MNDSIIAHHIRTGNHSVLTFLESDAEQASNENYLGFYYFSLEAQGKSTDDALRKITEVQGSKSNVYVYLGDIAGKVFSEPNEAHIARYFYKQAIECDDNNAQAWWKLYYADRQLSPLLKTLNIDYNNQDFKSINQKLLSVNMVAERDGDVRRK